MFATRADGSRALLGEVVEVFDRHLAGRFSIVGGWAPALRCKGPIPHPGTKDVDLLCDVENDRAAIEQALRDLMAAGYYVSAKHSFQLIRILDCGGVSLAFNLDLLYPGELSEHVEFSKIFDLPVRESPIDPSLIGVASVVLPEAKFLIHGWSKPCEQQFLLPDGRQVCVHVPLLGDIGLVFSKSESWSKPKRDRDAFDIYLTLAQPADPAELRDDADRLGKEYPLVRRDLRKRCNVMLANDASKFAALVQRTNAKISRDDVRARLTDLLDILSS
ncbi:MAG TPA: hypothetical protein VGM88_17815 [Kofleriaceae bacterium]|jgi:hypothetical protein